jgi:hypothetical protein
MLDYYGNIAGPNKTEAKIQVLNSINFKINNNTYLKYISNNEKIEIINNVIENNYNGISSYSGWCTFTMKDLLNLSTTKLEELNIQKKTIFLFNLKILLKKNINDNCIEKIIKCI